MKEAEHVRPLASRPRGVGLGELLQGVLGGEGKAGGQREEIAEERHRTSPGSGDLCHLFSHCENMFTVYFLLLVNRASGF